MLAAAAAQFRASPGPVRVGAAARGGETGFGAVRADAMGRLQTMAAVADRRMMNLWLNLQKDLWEQANTRASDDTTT